MAIKVIKTNDGSTTLYNEELDETYHSRHGALQEAQHVFLKNGLHCFSSKNEITIFEMGFGTGLNAMLTLLTKPAHQHIKYVSIEKFPISLELALATNYIDLLNEHYNTDVTELFTKMHECAWNTDVEIVEGFTLHKIEDDILTADLTPFKVDLIYYDAFGARVQDFLWQEDVISKVLSPLQPKGIFVTYSAKGTMKRALKANGLEVNLVEGPPGKREMAVGIKL